MNAVERMMKEYGVEPLDIYHTCQFDENKGQMCNTDCGICKNTKEMCFYPPFTAEKQIELIKYIGTIFGSLTIIRSINDEFRIEAGAYRKGYYATLADAIADFLIEKKNILDTAKVKEILEG